jgi:hypothetical protein
VPSNLPVQQIESIAAKYAGKEVWVVGPEHGWGKWKVIADKFDMLHLGNFIVSTTIRRLITLPQPDAPDSGITPAMSRLFNSNFAVAPTVVTMPKVRRSPLSFAGAGVIPSSDTPYIMVVDDNHIVSFPCRSNRGLPPH